MRNTGETDLVLRGVTLIDERTGTHAALTMPADGAFARVHSGDVKVYENLQPLPRAYLAGGVAVVEDDEAALAVLAAPDFDPARTTVLLQSDVESLGPGGALDRLAGGEVAVTRYAPEDVELRVHTEQPGLLVLADTWYPGWVAAVDGAPAPVLRADTLFRGVPVPAGEHMVAMQFRPASLRAGLLVTAAAAVLLLALLAVGVARRSQADARKR
ncbi:MAG: YfhO family protein [Caldilineales bacterium]